MKKEWIPLIRLGDIVFDNPIAPYIESRFLIRQENDSDGTGWETYAISNDSLQVHIDDGRITSVACYDECILEQTNLIGISIEEAKKLIGSEPSIDADILNVGGELQQVFEFNEVEAQIWVKDGKIVTVFCGSRCENEPATHAGK